MVTAPRRYCEAPPFSLLSDAHQRERPHSNPRRQWLFSNLVYGVSPPLALAIGHPPLRFRHGSFVPPPPSLFRRLRERNPLAGMTRGLPNNQRRKPGSRRGFPLLHTRSSFLLRPKNEYYLARERPYVLNASSYPHSTPNRSARRTNVPLTREAHVHFPALFISHSPLLPSPDGRSMDGSSHNQLPNTRAHWVRDRGCMHRGGGCHTYLGCRYGLSPVLPARPGAFFHIQSYLVNARPIDSRRCAHISRIFHRSGVSRSELYPGFNIFNDADVPPSLIFTGAHSTLISDDGTLWVFCSTAPATENYITLSGYFQVCETMKPKQNSIRFACCFHLQCSRP
ncbi:hypothetical protein B0H16DRAFT_203415 [Mycena metata]|uniref:Uncharacterized protein n=1 Tax=Mycena metata TaxID=1033252 RepID=A0AAD7HZ11_9AGAR|nr:hypothetical protein B0H16DRAFT_203415 [Mycena metata]